MSLALRKTLGWLCLWIAGCLSSAGSAVDDARAAFEGGEIARPFFVASTHDNATQRPMLGISRDGVAFERITPFNFTPPAGDDCRDCSLVFWKGRYYLAYTAGVFGAAPYFGIAVSDDLINWTHHANVATAPNYTWAPEWVVDGSDVYVTYSKMDEFGSWRVFFVKSLSPQLDSWTAQEMVGGVNIGYSLFDAHVSRYHHTWLLVCRNYSGTGAKIFQSTTSPVTGYSPFSSPDWGTTQEGQFLTNLGGGKLRMYFLTTPGAPEMQMSFADSADGGLTFGDIHPITGNFESYHMSVYGFAADEVPPLQIEIVANVAKISYGSAVNLIMESTEDLAAWKTVTPEREGSTGNWTAVLPIPDAPKCFWRIHRPY